LPSLPKRVFYVGVNAGLPSAEYEVAGTDETVSGLAYGLEVGLRLTQMFALEVGYNQANFEKITGTAGTTGNELTQESELQFTNITYGLRLFLGNYFNIKLGGLSSNFDPQSSYTGTGIYAAFATAFNGYDWSGTGTGTYYGIGFQYPMGMMDLYFDYTAQNMTIEFNESAIDGDDTGYTTTNVGVRFNF
jgi:hypothetical protein